jgi:DNA-binding transcriptional LysR family regulator
MADPPHVPGVEELPHLASFVGIAERGSFTATADALGLTQAAVGQRLAGLERELRTSLFDRRPGRIALTEAGHSLYERARLILDLHQQARRDLGELRPDVAGRAASSDPGACLLPALLSAFHSRHPLVRVRATVSDSGSVVKEVMRVSDADSLRCPSLRGPPPAPNRAPPPLGPRKCSMFSSRRRGFGR